MEDLAQAQWISVFQMNKKVAKSRMSEKNPVKVQHKPIDFNFLLLKKF